MKFKNKEVEIEVKAKALRWKNRRKMAYIALVSIMVVMYWAIFKIPDERIKILQEIVIWFFMVMGSVVGTYVGFSTFDDKWNNEYKNAKELIEKDSESSENE